MHDLTAPSGTHDQSWVIGNLLPVVTMYHTTGPKKGLLTTFFFPVPVCQLGLKGDWDGPPPGVCGVPTTSTTLPNFCLNYCNKDCHWDNDFMNTEHVYFDADPETNV